MIKHFFSILTTVGLMSLSTSVCLKAQDTANEGFKFDTLYIVKTTPVKNQANSGTCWSFATTSFVETELMRIGKPETDLSEMFFVRHIYSDKGIHYVRMHGTSNYSPGGQAHHVINTIKNYGFITEEAYNGLNYGEKQHIHSELDEASKAFLDAVVKNPNRKLTTSWKNAFEDILDAYLGQIPDKFNWLGKNLSPKEAADESGFNADDYIELTSYSVYPFYQPYALEVPDNYDMKPYYNIPVDDLINIALNALKNGYSVCWDGDVSDKGFSHNKGVAIIPDAETTDLTGSEKAKWEKLTEKEKIKSAYSFEKPVPEKHIGQAERDIAFDNQKTTDDHLMHLTGIVTDQKGTKYFITKNSWGTESNEFGGYLNMSETYFRLNTIAIMVHKSAIPGHIAKKLGIR